MALWQFWLTGVAVGMLILTPFLRHYRQETFRLRAELHKRIGPPPPPVPSVMLFTGRAPRKETLAN